MRYTQPNFGNSRIFKAPLCEQQVSQILLFQHALHKSMSKLFLVEDFGPGPRNNVNQCKPIAMVMMREWWGRAHNRLSAFETQQFELVWICLTSVPCSRHLPKSNSFDTNIIFTSLLLSLLAFQKQHGWGHQLLKWVHTHWIQSPHSLSFQCLE